MKKKCKSKRSFYTKMSSDQLTTKVENQCKPLEFSLIETELVEDDETVEGIWRGGGFLVQIMKFLQYRNELFQRRIENYFFEKLLE